MHSASPAVSLSVSPSNSPVTLFCTLCSRHIFTHFPLSWVSTTLSSIDQLLAWKSFKSRLIVILLFYGSLMINIDTLNLLRLNSVSPCQPVDSNTRKTHTHTRIISGLDCQLAYSWENGYHDNSRCSIWGSCCCCILSSMRHSLVILYPSIQQSTATQRGLNPDYPLMPNYTSITSFLEDITFHRMLSLPPCLWRPFSAFMKGASIKAYGLFTKHFFLNFLICFHMSGYIVDMHFP